MLHIRELWKIAECSGHPPELLCLQVLEVLDEEVLEAAQCKGLAEGDCVQQGQTVSLLWPSTFW